MFDINLDYTQAMNRLQYLVDGNYIDNATKSVQVLLTTYNGQCCGTPGGALLWDVTLGSAVLCRAAVLCCAVLE